MADATFSVTPTHTLSDVFFGNNVHGKWSTENNFGGVDCTDTGYRALLVDLGLESVRWHHATRSVLNADGENLLQGLAEHLATNSGTKSLQQYWAGSLSVDRANGRVNVTNVAADGSGYSPQDLADDYATWDDAGITIHAIELNNEANGATFGSAYFTAGQDGFDAQTTRLHYVAALHRVHAGQVAAEAATRGNPLTVYLGGGFDYTAQNMTVRGLGQINGWPHPDTNIPYLDGFSPHGYGEQGTTSNLQSEINSIFVDTNDTNIKSLYSKYRSVRETFDLIPGGATKTGRITETAINAGISTTAQDATGSLADVGIAICAANFAGDLLIDGFDFFGLSGGATGFSGGFFIKTDGGAAPSYQPTCRYYTSRDMIGPFLRTYKRVSKMTITGSGTTPTDGGVPGVNRIWGVTGLNAAGTKRGYLIGHFDLSGGGGTQVLNVPVPEGPSGNVTGKVLSQGQGFAAIPAATPIVPVGNAFALSIAPRQAFFLEVDVADAGLTMSTAGRITGTPLVPGTFNFTARVTDSEGLTDTQALTIVVTDQNTPTADPTLTAGQTRFGYVDGAGAAIIGQLRNALGADKVFLNKHTTGLATDEQADIRKVHFFAGGDAGVAGTQNVRAVFYEDDGANGEPGTLIGQTGELTMTSGDAEGWQTITVAADSLVVTGANVWVGLRSGTTALLTVVAKDNATGANRPNTQTYTSAPTDPYGASTPNANLHSLLIDYVLEAGTGGSAGDTAPPTLVGATVQRDVLTLQFSEPLLATEASSMSSDRFTVTVNNKADAVTAINVVGAQVILTLETRVRPGDLVALTYTEPTP